MTDAVLQRVERLEGMIRRLSSQAGLGPASIFGSGQLGNVVKANDANGGGILDTLSYNVPLGVTVTLADPKGSLLVRAMNKITIGGTVTGVGSIPFGSESGVFVGQKIAGGGGGGGGGGTGNAAASPGFPGRAGAVFTSRGTIIGASAPGVLGSAGAAGVSAAAGGAGVATTPAAPGYDAYFSAQLADILYLLVQGGGPGAQGGAGGQGGQGGGLNGASPGAGGTAGAPGNGGGSIVLIAPEIDILATGSLLTGGTAAAVTGIATAGAAAGAGNSGGGGGGGGAEGSMGGNGGPVVLVAYKISQLGTITTTGGAGALGGAGGAGGAGNGTGTIGGAGGAGPNATPALNGPVVQVLLPQ